ncbi:MAG: N-methylproline demethylase, partial [Dehalococcoidia bacterium]
MVTSQFKHLFSPFQLRNLTLPNRIVSTAHATALADNGKPGPRLNAYHAEKARGGCGLVMVYGAAAVHPTSPAADWGGVELFDDSVIPHLKEAAAAVHKYGSKIISQI